MLQNKRTLLVALAMLCIGAPALGSALAAQSVPRTSAGSASVGVTAVDPGTVQVELEGQASFVPADGTPHKVADIKIGEINFIYDFSASAPTLSSPGTFGPPASCGLGTKAYSIATSWVSGSDFHSNGPPLTDVGDLHVEFPVDAVVGCIGFGAMVSVTFTVIGPDESD